MTNNTRVGARPRFLKFQLTILQALRQTQTSLSAYLNGQKVRIGSGWHGGGGDEEPGLNGGRGNASCTRKVEVGED